MRCTVMDQTRGAEWYSGAGLRYTSPSPKPMMRLSIGTKVADVPKGSPVRARRTPLG